VWYTPNLNKLVLFDYFRMVPVPVHGSDRKVFRLWRDQLQSEMNHALWITTYGSYCEMTAAWHRNSFRNWCTRALHGIFGSRVMRPFQLEINLIRTCSPYQSGNTKDLNIVSDIGFRINHERKENMWVQECIVDQYVWSIMIDVVMTVYRCQLTWVSRRRLSFPLCWSSQNIVRHWSIQCACWCQSLRKKGAKRKGCETDTYLSRW